MHSQMVGTHKLCDFPKIPSARAHASHLVKLSLPNIYHIGTNSPKEIFSWPHVALDKTMQCEYHS